MKVLARTIKIGIITISLCGGLAGCQRQYRVIGKDLYTTTREYLKSTDNYSLRAVLWHSRGDRPTDFFMDFSIGHRKPGEVLKISALKLSLTDSVSHSALEIIDPVNLHIEPQEVKKWHTLSETQQEISSGKLYDLSERDYVFRYHFRGAYLKHSPKFLRLKAEANLQRNGKSEQLKQIIVFRRSVVMNISGN